MPWLMRWAVVMMRLCAACRNTSVSRTTGMAPEEITSARTCPVPQGKLVDIANDQQSGGGGYGFYDRLHQHDVHHGGLVDNQQVAIESIVVAALEPSRLGVDFKQPVDSFGFKAGRLGHPLGAGRLERIATAGRLLPREPEDGFDNGGLADPRSAGHHQRFRHQRELNGGDLTFGKSKPDPILDPWQGLVWINPCPRGLPVGKLYQTLSNNSLGPIQSC